MRKLDWISKKIITDNDENWIGVVFSDFLKSYQLSPSTFTKIKN